LTIASCTSSGLMSASTSSRFGPTSAWVPAGP
jgi:hypothetical protein